MGSSLIAKSNSRERVTGGVGCFEDGKHHADENDT